MVRAFVKENKQKDYGDGRWVKEDGERNDKNGTIWRMWNIDVQWVLWSPLCHASLFSLLLSADRCRRDGKMAHAFSSYFIVSPFLPLFYHRSIELVANSSIYFSFFYCFYFSSLRSSFRDKFLIRRANFNFSIRRKGILLLSSFRTTFSFLSHVFQLKFESKQVSKKISNTKFQKSFITYLQTCGHFHLFSVYQIIPPGVHVRFIDVT